MIEPIYWLVSDYFCISLVVHPRCQSHLQSVDGSKWREKLPGFPSVSPCEIPDICTPEEAPSALSSLSLSVSSSHKTSAISSNSSASQTAPPALQTKSSSMSSSLSSSVSPYSEKTNSKTSKIAAKEESFDDVKVRGNEHVKNVSKMRSIHDFFGSWICKSFPPISTLLFKEWRGVLYLYAIWK